MFLKQLFVPLTTKKASLIIAILGFIVFGNALFNGFVWDDTIFLINPERFSTNILHFFTSNLARSVGYYRPIYLLYFALLYKVFGSQAFFYHFLQIVLHIINAIILYLILNYLFGRIDAKAKEAKKIEWNSLSGSQKIKYQRMHVSGVKALPTQEPKIKLLSLFLSLVFLVHPINVESVAYFAASNSELFFLFGILALWISMKEKIKFKDLFLVSGLTLSSLLSKETGFVFPLMIVSFQFLYHRMRFLKFFFFELATLAIYFYIRFAIGGVYFSKFITILPVPISRLSFLERLVNIPQIVLYYLTTTFFPLRLAIQQQWVITTITAQGFYLPLLLDSMFFIALCLGGVYIYKYKRSYFKAFLFFFLWFISGLLLLLQIFPLDMTVADRFFYFPLIGLLGMLGVGVQTLLFSPNKHDTLLVHYDKAKIVTALFGAFLIILLSLRTIVRNTNFYDNMTLYTHDSQIYDNSTMEDYLGRSYASVGNMHASFTHLQKSVNLYPYPNNLLHLGNWYESMKNVQKAQEYYYKSLSAADAYYSINNTRNQGESDLDIYIRLTKLLYLSGRAADAEKISKKGLQYYPNSVILWEDLALCEYKLHNQKEALAAAEKAKTLFPSDITNILYSLIVTNQNIISLLAAAIVNQVK